MAAMADTELGVLKPDVEALKALSAYHQSRVRNTLQQYDYAGLLLYDPVNIRYATGIANQQVWSLHNSARYALVSAGWNCSTVLAPYRKFQARSSSISGTSSGMK